MTFLTPSPDLPDTPTGPFPLVSQLSCLTFGHTHTEPQSSSHWNSLQEEDRDNTNFSAIVSGLKNLTLPGKNLRGPVWAGRYVGEEQEQGSRVPASLPPSRGLCEPDVHLPTGLAAAKFCGALEILPILWVSDHTGL